jgi:hypothetical protein
MNTPGSRFLGVFGTSIRTGLQKKLSGEKNGELRLPDVFCTGSLFCKPI